MYTHVSHLKMYYKSYTCIFIHVYIHTYINRYKHIYIHIHIHTHRIIRGDKEPGDLGLGQTGFNPFKFDYSEEEYFEKQVQEIKHGR
jgi:hypothetical protein